MTSQTESARAFALARVSLMRADSWSAPNPCADLLRHLADVEHGLRDLGADYADIDALAESLTFYTPERGEWPSVGGVVEYSNGQLAIVAHAHESRNDLVVLRLSPEEWAPALMVGDDWIIPTEDESGFPTMAEAVAFLRFVKEA